MNNTKKHNKPKRVRNYDAGDWIFEVPTYFVLDVQSGNVNPCKSVNHACAIAFGKDKELGCSRFLACVRTRDSFRCM